MSCVKITGLIRLPKKCYLAWVKWCFLHSANTLKVFFAEICNTCVVECYCFVDFYKKLEASFAEIIFLIYLFPEFNFRSPLAVQVRHVKSSDPYHIFGLPCRLEASHWFDASCVATLGPPHQNQRLLSQLGFPIFTWTWALTLRQLRYKIIEPLSQFRLPSHCESSDSPHTVSVPYRREGKHWLYDRSDAAQ